MNRHGRPLMAEEGRALVLGAGVAGLFAGRVLADFFDEVILLDKESLDGGPAPRKAVPQGNHIHAILTPTYHALERFLPELIQDLVDGGAHVFDAGKDWQFHIHGSFLASGPTGQTLIGSTRPFFEHCLRRRVTELENLVLRTEHRFERWISRDGRIEGAIAQHDGQRVELRADLVVDARGLASTLTQELPSLGYPTPSEEVVGVDLGYTSRLYELKGRAPEWTLLILNPSPPQSWIGGLIEHVEGDRWIVTQFGYFGDHAPADDEGFLDRARALAVSDIADFLERAEPVSEFRTFGTRDCRMRRFEKLEPFPERLIVLGDAVCSLNPIYGQGMTKAAREAVHLRHSLAEHLEAMGALDGFSGSFRRSLPAAGAEWAWQLTTGADLAYPRTRGERRRGGGLMGWYVRRLFLQSARSLDARKRLADVLMLSVPPDRLMKPRMMLHALGI